MSNRLIDALGKRVLVLDGGMGTATYNYDLTVEGDYCGCENCTDILTKSRPELVQEIHESFFRAGSDAVETNTFGTPRHVLSEFDLQDECFELSKRSAEIARAAADTHSTSDKPRFVLGSMGPGTKLITLGQIEWGRLYSSYKEAMKGLIAGGSDALLVETCQDLLQVKCAINAAMDAIDESGKSIDDVPIMVSLTIEQMGTMLVGSSIEAAVAALREYPVASLGLNCATGPAEMTEYIQYIGRNWERHISCYPNAGLPILVEGRTEYPLQPGPFTEALLKFIEHDGVGIVGGCCGTTPEHLGTLAEAVEGKVATRKEAVLPRVASSSSLYTPVPHRQENTFLIVGERCNASGSRKFKRLLEEEDWDSIVSLAKEQVREGSHVLDVNVDYAGRDNVADMKEVVKRLVRQVDAPLMIDSTQVATLEAGLSHSAGRCIINSANFEDGEEKFDEICRLARTYNAALVIGTIDEDPDQAMARTADRKASITERAIERASSMHGIDVSDIFIDPLVLPISTGMDSDRRSALELVEGTRRITEKFPEVQTTCGLSNVSFGLKPAARIVLNSVFLHELTDNGMSSAIVHASKILPLNKIEEEHYRAALDLIYDRRHEDNGGTGLPEGVADKGFDPLQAFIDLFKGVDDIKTGGPKMEDLSLEERLRKHIIDGEKENLEGCLDEAMRTYAPLDIVNDHLLDGMKTVGELFGSGQMQLPFVLQSAEVMKKAVAHLEPHMEKVEGEGKGSIVLATVKGDVHDIGKNLVDIILSNNGYTVHNIGIKQPISDILKAFEETKADAIGLSGLLVKSVNVMEENIKEMNDRGVKIPLLLGGAALARSYAEGYLRGIYEGNLLYGKDAFEGLRIMDHISTGKVDVLESEIEERQSKRSDAETKSGESRAEQGKRQTRFEKAKAAMAGKSGPGSGGGDIGSEGVRSNGVGSNGTGANANGTGSQRAGGGGVEEDPMTMPDSGPEALPEEGGEAPDRERRLAPAASIEGSDRGPLPSEETAAVAVLDRVRSEVRRDVDVPAPPFWGSRVVAELPMEPVFAHINPVALYRVQWQFKRGDRTKEEFEREIAEEAVPTYERLRDKCLAEDILRPSVVYGYYPVASRGDDLILFDPKDQDREIERFTFPRQGEGVSGNKRLCISDFFRDEDECREMGRKDVLGMSCVTVGKRATEVAQDLFKSNRYQEYLYMHGLSVEAAEGLAELWHKRMRQELGIDGEDSPRMKDLFSQKYRGSRYSFGYPACPDMSDQEIMWRLIEPQRIGCELTENWQIDPEQSTSAIIVHHPEAKYFNA